MLGFWSYVHADDETDMGRVSQLARDLVSNYEALRGESIKLFLDRDDLHWGDTWRSEINGALSNVAFFVAVLTPRYFQSPECRREFQYFSERASALGVTQIVMPLLYIDVPALHGEETSDPIVEYVQKVQWEDWMDLRFKERSSEQYRRGVAALANEMARRVVAVERIDVIPAVEAQEDGLDEGECFIDQMVALEEALPRWGDTLTKIQKEMEIVAAVVSKGTREIDRSNSQGKGFAARLTVARRLANELSEPTDEVERLSQLFVSDLNRIDIGFRHIIKLGENISEDAEEADQYRMFLRSVKDVSAAANEGLGSLQGLITAIEPAEQISKDMRPPLRRLRRALTSMLEARAITDSWLEIVESK